MKTFRIWAYSATLVGLFTPGLPAAEPTAVDLGGSALRLRFTEDGGSLLAAGADGAFHPVWVDNRTGVCQVWAARAEVRGGRRDE